MNTETSSPASPISRLLRPRSVAIVGASPTPGALGAAVLANLERAGYRGDIHLINPKRAEINGRACKPSIDELPMGVDCAVLAIPHAAVLESVRACARRGVGGVIIFSAGFAEGGDAGRAEQEEIARIAREHDMIVEGPNCLGLVNYVDGIPLTFVLTEVRRTGGRPGVAVVSQSGAMAAVLGVSLTSHDLTLSFSVSTGNEAVSGVEDYLEYVVEDPAVKVVTMIVEQFRKPRRFLELARRARLIGKPIVLLHPGRSSAARESAATHTGAMAGDYQVMRSLVARAGVVVVDALEELIDVTDIALRCSSRPQGGCGVLTESGAFKALTLDLCEQVGLALAPVSDTVRGGLREVLPDFIPVSNPMDLTAQALVDPELYRRTMAVLLNDDSIGSLVLGLILTDQATSDLKLPSVIGAIKDLRPTKPVVFAALDEGAEVPKAYIDELRGLGVPCFPSAERAFRAVAQLSATTPHDPGAPVRGQAPSVLAQASGVVPEYRAKVILAAFGVALPRGRFAGSVDEAVAAAEAIGYPVVLKAQSADLSHKSDAGGVVLNLGDAQALRQGWDRLHANVARARPGLVLDGVLVEAMGKRGIELIVGARNDRDWGPVLLVGMGGVMAELLHDARLIPANLPATEIAKELLKLKCAPLLRGFRGDPAADIEAAAEVVAKIGALVQADPRIREIDVNPVVVYAAGEGAVALDALIYID
jgi:acetate---CoA ligase (ADP-forming)